MTIIELNSTSFGSTGNIVKQVAEAAEKRNHQVYICCPKSRSNMKKIPNNQIFIGNRIINNIHRIFGTMLGLNGLFSIFSTLSFINRIDKLNPDVIHLHNLHNYYINLPILFNYIKRGNAKVVWTLHDCWSFTGKCTHFSYAKCAKWKTGCGNCIQLNEYPAAKLDTSRIMWKKKREWFSGVDNMTIVTPSQWLSSLVKQSFLRDYSTIVINNGIDHSVFYHIESDFRKKNGFDNIARVSEPGADSDCTNESNNTMKAKYMILGVAFGWGERKGLDDFIWLASHLSEEYRIVLVGTDDEIDKKLPANIISVHRTDTQSELAKIYSAADVFVNPTREDTFPTVNIEALACGTPVITFDVGGSPEIIDKNSGVVVRVNDDNELLETIEQICTNLPFTREECEIRGREFDKKESAVQYIKLFEEMI